MLQHQLLQHEAVDYGLRLQIQQGTPQSMLDPERQQQTAAQHGADGADEQGDPIQVDALHRLHQIPHHHGTDGAPVRPDHRGEAADGRPQGTHVLGAVAAALVEGGPDILAAKQAAHQLRGGVAQPAGVLVGHHHVGGIGATADPLHIVAQARIAPPLQRLHHPVVSRQHPRQISPLVLQIALQQMAYEERQQAAQNDDQEQ